MSGCLINEREREIDNYIISYKLYFYITEVRFDRLVCSNRFENNLKFKI